MITNRRLLLALPLLFFAACGEGTSEPQVNSEDASTGGSDAGTGGSTAGTGGSAAQGAGGTPGTGGSAGNGTGGMTGSAGTGGMTSNRDAGADASGMTASGGVGGRTTATGGAAGGGAGAGGAGAGGIAGSGSGGGAGAGTGAPAIRVVGRTEAGPAAGSIQYSWPGVNIQANFMATQASMTVNNASANNRVTVVVDAGTPRTIALASGQSTVSLASGLANGAHQIVIWRNTEASPGDLTTFSGLTGFGSGGALLAPSTAPARRIEMVGDSLTVGAGVEGDATCTGGIDAFTNNYLAYGSIAARALSADVVTIAYSGIGVYRNFGETTPTAASLTMPRRYPYAIPDTALWNFSLYQPQVVVINLGTNDFGAGDPGTPYETAYVSFVQDIRAKYADAYFVLIDMYGGARLTRLDNVLAALKSAGESKVEVLSLNAVQNNLGCNQHPNVAGQQGMGNTLAARLRVVMGW
jgi:lysophospholipase L1-like esterase